MAETPVLDMKALEAKVDKGETLTPAEESFIMSEGSAPEDYQEPMNKEVVEDPAPIEGEDPESTEGVAPAAAKPAAPAKEDAPAPQVGDELFVKLETELAKPEDKADTDEQLATKGWTKVEIGYYRQMRKDRKELRHVEADRDAILFRESKLKKELADAKAGKPAEPAEVDPFEELKKRQPDDVMTVADAIALVEKIAKKAEKPAGEDPNKPKADAPKGPSSVQLAYLRMCDKEAHAAHPEDYEAVIELTKEILDVNQEYLVKVGQAIINGDNPAEVSYQLIKGDPEFARLFPVAETKVKARKAGQKPSDAPKPAAKTAEELAKEAKAKAAEEKLKDLKNKTTGHVGTGDDPGLGEHTAEQIAAMSDREFSALPKKVRQTYLQKYG